MSATKPRLFEDLSRAEARRFFDEHVAGHPDRLALLFDEVRRRGWPVDRLDFTRGSLGELWRWVLTQVDRPSAPHTDDELRAAGPPWWYEFHPPLGQEIGPELAHLVAPLAAYFAETIIRTRPGSAWTLDADRRSANYQRPLLQVAGRGAFSPDTIVLVVLVKWVRGEPTEEDLLVRLYDVRAGKTGDPVPSESTSSPGAQELVVEHVPDDAFNTVVTFDHVVAHEEDERITRFVEALGREPGIERAVREDREIVLVSAPRLEPGIAESAIRRLWVSTAES